MTDKNVTRGFPLTLFPTIPRMGTHNDGGQGHGRGRSIAPGFRELTALPGFHIFGRPHFERVKVGGYRIPNPRPLYLEPETVEPYVPNLPSFQCEPPAAPPPAAPAFHHPISTLESIKSSGLFSSFELKCFESFPDLTKMDSSSVSFQILFSNVMEKYGISNTGFFDGSTEEVAQCIDNDPKNMLSLRLPRTPAFLSRLRTLARTKLVTVTEELHRRKTLNQNELPPLETIHVNNDTLSEMFQLPKGIYVLMNEDRPPSKRIKIDVDANVGPMQMPVYVPPKFQSKNPYTSDFQNYMPKKLLNENEQNCKLGMPKSIAKVKIPNVEIIPRNVLTKREKLTKSGCNAPECRGDPDPGHGPDANANVEDKFLPTTVVHYEPKPKAVTVDMELDPSTISVDTNIGGDMNAEINWDDVVGNIAVDIEMLNQDIYREDPSVIELEGNRTRLEIRPSDTTAFTSRSKAPQEKNQKWIKLSNEGRSRI